MNLSDGSPSGSPGTGRAPTACTIIARNYEAHARVLKASFTDFHPSASFHTLVVDGDESDRSNAALGTVLLPGDLGMPLSQFRSMAAIYDVMELATALKPALLMALIRRGADAAAYFDPDIQIFAPLHDVFESAKESSVFLTPHVLKPVPRDGLELRESTIMGAGMYNLGFIAVGPQSYSHLHWWHERLETDAINDISLNLFTDQRWMDWTPSISDHAISRDPGLNVAYWNLHERDVAQTETGEWTANGAPLRFFHFSGYNADQPWSLSKHMGTLPRIKLSENSAVRDLCDDYRDALLKNGLREHIAKPYRYARSAGGMALTPLIRRLIRDAMLRGDGRVPDPFAVPDGLTPWLDEPIARWGSESISRIEYAFWESRVDLRTAFPDVVGAHVSEYRNWLRHEQPFECLVDITDSTLPVTASDITTSVRDRFAHARWNVVGYFSAELGVGEAGRRVARAVSATGVPSNKIDISVLTESRQEASTRWSGIETHADGENVILCVNADQLPRINKILELGNRGGKKIGLWFWELDRFPARNCGAFDLLHEVWVASTFTQEALQAKTDLPVSLIRLPARHRPATRHDRASLGMPSDKIVFLVSFDFFSDFQRKNPLGAIRAYLEAFEPSDNTCLMVRSINGHRFQVQLEQLRYEVAHRDDVIIRDGYLSPRQMDSLIGNADCLVSLHRSEGYGLHMADAMSFGTPVVATGYSGNMTFMDPETALLVDFDLRPVGPGCGPYDPTAVWAQPVQDSAARAMRRIVDDVDGVRTMTARARRKHLGENSLEAASASIKGSILPELLVEGRARP